MDDKFDTAITKLVDMFRPNMKAEDAMKFSQSALNLAHAKQILEGKIPTRKQGAGA